MYKTFKENLLNGDIYVDLEGSSIAGGTIPPHILTTNQRPDLVIINEESLELTIVELTVPFETNLDDAHTRKTDKYSGLVQDIREKGYTVSFFAVEVGVRGLVSRDNKHRQKQILKKSGSLTRPPDLFQSLSKHAVLSSFTIFYARKQQSWGDVQHVDL